MRLHPMILVSISFIVAMNTQVQALTLGVEETNYTHYYYLNDKQQYQGAAREIFDLFFKISDLEIHFNPMPVPRLFNKFVKGSVELKFPDNPLWSASLNSTIKVYYSEAVFNVNESLLVLKQDELEIDKENIKIMGTILDLSISGIAKPVANNEFKTIKQKKLSSLFTSSSQNVCKEYILMKVLHRI
jgi:polar amino acid transport system substrate-binding protein